MADSTIWAAIAAVEFLMAVASLAIAIKAKQDSDKTRRECEAFCKQLSEVAEKSNMNQLSFLRDMLSHFAGGKCGAGQRFD